MSRKIKTGDTVRVINDSSGVVESGIIVVVKRTHTATGLVEVVINNREYWWLHSHELQHLPQYETKLAKLL